MVICMTQKCLLASRQLHSPHPVTVDCLGCVRMTTNWLASPPPVHHWHLNSGREQSPSKKGVRLCDGSVKLRVYRPHGKLFGHNPRKWLWKRKDQLYNLYKKWPLIILCIYLFVDKCSGDRNVSKSDPTFYSPGANSLWFHKDIPKSSLGHTVTGHNRAGICPATLSWYQMNSGTSLHDQRSPMLINDIFQRGVHNQTRYLVRFRRFT